jgi:hypothetical protein
MSDEIHVIALADSTKQSSVRRGGKLLHVDRAGHPGGGLSAGRRGDSVMARAYRENAIEEMLRTVEEAMSGVIDWWGDLPPPMKEAIEQFRTQLGTAIDSVEFVRRALDRQAPETDHGERPA